MATARIARGMSRRGSCASSPSVAAASNPAKERNPNTTPRNRADAPVPPDTATTEKSRVLPFGAVPVASRIRIMTLTMSMSATVVPSMTSSTLVPPPDVRGRQRPHAGEGDRTDDERRPPWLVCPDAEGFEEFRTEDAGRCRRDDAVEGIRAHKRPPGDDTGPRPERRPDEAVHAASVIKALGEPDEGPGDQEHADGRKSERERNGAPHAGVGGALRVDVGRHGRRHERQRDTNRLPQMQLTPQMRTLGGVGFCGH